MIENQQQKRSEHEMATGCKLRRPGIGVRAYLPGA